MKSKGKKKLNTDIKCKLKYNLSRGIFKIGSNDPIRNITINYVTVKNSTHLIEPRATTSGGFVLKNGAKKKKKILDGCPLERINKTSSLRGCSSKNNEPMISSFPRLNRAHECGKATWKGREKEETKRDAWRITFRPSFDPANLFVDDLIIGLKVGQLAR